ncbi:unnamed protein product [Choristocarpus tenellus]
MAAVHRWGRLAATRIRPNAVTCRVSPYSTSSILWASGGSAVGAPASGAGSRERGIGSHAGGAPSGDSQVDSGGSKESNIFPEKVPSKSTPGGKEEDLETPPQFGVWGRPRKQRVEVEYGHFHEFTAVNKTAGKIFEADADLCSPDEALHFPEMDVCSLMGEQAKFPARLIGGVTLVGLYHRQFGYEMLPTWSEPFEEEFRPPNRSTEAGVASAARDEGKRKGGRGRGRERFGVGQSDRGMRGPEALHVSLIESTALRLIKPLVVRSMEGQVSEGQKAAFFHHFGGTSEIREKLGIVNRLTLYMFLVDWEGRVRWRGCGKSTPHEVETLLECTKKLMQEGVEADGGARAKVGGRQRRW